MAAPRWLAVALCCAVSGYAPARRLAPLRAARLAPPSPTARRAESDEGSAGGPFAGFSLPSFGKGDEAPEEEAASAPGPILAGAPFTVAEFPTDTDGMVDAYRRWSAVESVMLTEDEARRDIQCFLAEDGLMEKWRPVLASAAAEANKKTFVDYVNDFTSIALPIAIGFTVLPILRQGGESIPVLNDVVIPKIDAGIDLIKSGFKKLVELPICLEFGDC